MEDLGAKWTDEKIAELEKRIVSLYSDAYDEIYEKYMAFCRKFERDDKKYSQQLQDGKITAATYRDWLRGQVFQRRRWQAQLDDLSKTLTRVNQIAMDIINGETSTWDSGCMTRIRSNACCETSRIYCRRPAWRFQRTKRGT